MKKTATQRIGTTSIATSNFKDGWIPTSTFKRLRRKLVYYYNYKDKKFNKQSEEGPEAKLPSMLLEGLLDKEKREEEEAERKEEGRGYEECLGGSGEHRPRGK